MEAFSVSASVSVNFRTFPFRKHGNDLASVSVSVWKPNFQSPLTRAPFFYIYNIIFSRYLSFNNIILKMLSICRTSPNFFFVFRTKKIGFLKKTNFKNSYYILSSKQWHEETSFFPFQVFAILYPINFQRKKIRWFQKGIICVGCLSALPIFIQSFNDIIFCVDLGSGLRNIEN